MPETACAPGAGRPANRHPRAGMKSSGSFALISHGRRRRPPHARPWCPANGSPKTRPADVEWIAALAQGVADALQDSTSPGAARSGSGWSRGGGHGDEAGYLNTCRFPDFKPVPGAHEKKPPRTLPRRREITAAPPSAGVRSRPAGPCASCRARPCWPRPHAGRRAAGRCGDLSPARELRGGIMAVAPTGLKSGELTGIEEPASSP